MEPVTVVAAFGAQKGLPYVFANDLEAVLDPSLACSFCGDAEEFSNGLFIWLFRCNSSSAREILLADFARTCKRLVQFGFSFPAT